MKLREQRRWFALALVLFVLGASAVGCSRDDGGSTNKTTTTGPDGKKGGEPQVGPGFDGTTISVGAITPQTGIASIIGLPLTAGNQVYFDALNDKGGVAGKYPVKLEVRDSKYDQNTAGQNYAELRENVVAFAQILGTSIVNSLLPQLKDDNLVASPATLDAEWVHNPNLAPIGGPYQVQAINALDYWSRNGGGEGKTLCVMRQDDLYGEAGMAGVEAAADAYGFEIGVDQKFKATDESFTAQLQAVKDGKCDAVYLVSLPTASTAILGDAAAAGFEVQWIGQSPTWISLLADGDLGAYTQKHFWLASEGTTWGDESVPGMKQLVGDVEKYAPEQKPDIYFAFGYAQAWAISQILEKAVELGDLSPEGIMKAMEEVGTLKFGDLLGDYKYGVAEDRVPPKTSTVFAVDPSVPGALKALETGFSSKEAEDFKDFG